mmetsp:Transcript_12641/g.26672  ORF Transcript_12641/g.26672 Transcript_12641/m.26672 type:complete len:259 (-) Transcript_12641:991-1767(-)
MCAAVSWGERSNMRSRACMLTSVCDTWRASVPSLRMLCMGPCSSLFTMPRDRSSTALRCFLSRSPIFFSAFSSSMERMSSALPLNRLMVGTVSRLSRHASKLACSSVRSVRASSAARARAPLLASTTSRRSSTLKTRWDPSSSFTSASTLRGTLMSNRRRMPPTLSEAGASVSRSFLASTGSSEEDATKTTSLFSVASMSSSISPISMSQSGKSFLSSSARGRLRFRMRIFLHPLLAKCFTSRRDILPAPTIRMRASL